MRYKNRRGEPMPLSLRIPSKKEEMIKKAAVKAGKSRENKISIYYRCCG